MSSTRWSAKQAHDWHTERGWIVGVNFVPSTAVNQLEMWQEATFDPASIERELGWGAAIGFNTVRVFLHDLLWQQDAAALLDRIDRFLSIAAAHEIRTLFVLFDSVWDPQPQPGPQPAPSPGVHNSRWVQGPHIDLLQDPNRHPEVEPYVQGVLERFSSDDRVLAWDLYNEPGNRVPVYADREPENKAELSAVFLRRVFDWAREVAPQQPLTAGIWQGVGERTDPLHPLDELLLERSDILTFHTYAPLGGVERAVDWLRTFGRPLLCTEYLARSAGSTFQEILPYFAGEGIGALSWGLVSGRSQTIYPWTSWGQPFDREPDVWFHDVLRADGTVYDGEETELIRSLTGRS